MHITNLVVKTTPFNENKKWGDALSLKIRLLQNSDWVLLPDSSVYNLEEWVLWRQKVKQVSRESSESPEQAKQLLTKLMESTPQVIKLDTGSIESFRFELIAKVKYYYNRKIETQCIDSDLIPLLVNERYEEAIAYKTKSKIQDFVLILNEVTSTGKTVKEVISSFKDDKLRMKLIIATNYNAMVRMIASIEGANFEELTSIYDRVRTWILISTLNQLVI
jgi:hypothetical protein